MGLADSAPNGRLLRIEVIHCAARGQVDTCRLELPDGATVQEAVAASGLLQRCPGLHLADTGIWGRAATATQRLRDGDRVELYRPLLVEPMDARRARQKHQRQQKAQGIRRTQPG